jgi:flagellar basal-body rod modification protein FlgD
MTEPVNGNNGYYLPDNSVKTQPKGLDDPEAFLKILVAQLKYQDPMQPQDSAAFVTQLSQLATMEQMYNVSRSMDNLAAKYEMSRYFEMIGQQVTLSSDDELITGKIGGVTFDDGKPYFYLAGAPNGQKYTLEQIVNVSGGQSYDLLPYLSLAGMQVKIQDGNQDITGVVEKIIMQNSGAAVQLGGQVYPVDLIKEIAVATPEETSSGLEDPETTASTNGDSNLAESTETAAGV